MSIRAGRAAPLSVRRHCKSHAATGTRILDTASRFPREPCILRTLLSRSGGSVGFLQLAVGRILDGVGLVNGDGLLRGRFKFP